MKLSEALQHCIDSDAYNYPHCEFMCHALNDTGNGEHKDAVMKHVRKLDVKRMQWKTLAAVLPETADMRSGYARFELTKAHYLKWIEELKSQGL